MLRRRLIIGAGVAALGAPALAKPPLAVLLGGARTVTFGSNSGDTYSGTQDCYLKSLTPTVNTNDTQLGINRFATGDHSSALVRFPGLSNIPASKTILSASIRVDCYLGSNTETVEVYKCLQPWTETGATWDTYDGSNAWNTAGALGSGSDRAAAASSSLSLVAAPGVSTFTGTQLAADVQSWIAGGAVNDGWIFPGSLTSLDAGRYKVFRSSTGLDGARIQLTVTYR